MLKTPATTTHPLAETLARSVKLNEYFYADTGSLEAGWFAGSDLLQEDKTRLDETLAHQATHYPQMDARTRGSYFIGEYSWNVPAVAVTAYLAEKRVPDLALDNLALRVSKYTWHENGQSGEAERMDARFLGGRFAALPDDPAADHPDAIIIPDELALREWLRQSIEAHFKPLIERVHAKTRLSRHAQWCLVADSVASLFLNGGLVLNNEVYGTEEGLAFVKTEGSPMNNPNTGYITLHYRDQRETFRERGGCCRYYTLVEDAHKCTSCVLRKPEERNQLLLEYMGRKYADNTTP